MLSRDDDKRRQSARRPREAREYNPSVFDLSQLNPLFFIVGTWYLVGREEGYSRRKGKGGTYIVPPYFWFSLLDSSVHRLSCRGQQ